MSEPRRSSRAEARAAGAAGDTARKDMIEAALAAPDALDKKERSLRNKERRIAEDGHFNALHGRTAELAKVTADMHAFLEEDWAKMTKAQIKERLAALAADHENAVAKEHDDDLSGPRREGDKDAEKGEKMLANREANALSQAQTKGMNDAETEAHVAAAAAAELKKQRDAQAAKDKEAADKLEAADARAASALEAVEEQKRQKAAAEQAAKEAAEAAAAAAEAAAEAAKVQTRAAEKKAREDKEERERLQRELAQAKLGQSTAPSEAGGDGPEAEGEPRANGLLGGDKPKSSGGKRKSKADIIAEVGEEAWEEQKAAKKQKADEAAEKKRKAILKEHGASKDARVEELQMMFDSASASVTAQRKKLNEATDAFKCMKVEKACFKERARRLAALIREAGANPVDPDELELVLRETRTAAANNAEAQGSA